MEYHANPGVKNSLNIHPSPHTPPSQRKQVLRSSKAALMTCAETFLADPLVEWTKQHRLAGQELDNPMVGWGVGDLGWGLVLSGKGVGLGVGRV